VVRGVGVNDVSVVDAFDLKAIRSRVKSALDTPEVSVVIVRGDCSVKIPAHSRPRIVDMEKCDLCGVCLLLGCSAIQREADRVYIDPALCVGDACTICQQLCPRQAIQPVETGDDTTR